jgi:hypothetical protein
MSTRKSGKSQETAAAKAAISERSGRRIEKGERLSIPGERHWRTREDPLDAIWEKELVPLLEQEAQLTGLTLWEYLESSLKIVRMPESGPVNHVGQLGRYVSLRNRFCIVSITTVSILSETASIPVSVNSAPVSKMRCIA